MEANRDDIIEYTANSMKNLSAIFSLAWRNVWRNKRRTVLTLLTITVGCAMIILMNAIAKGGHDRMIEDAVSMGTGHIQIHEKGFWENQTIDYAFMPDPSLLHTLVSNPAVAGYAPRVQAAALLSSPSSTAGALIQGIDPVRERLVSNLHEKVLKGGKFLDDANANNALIGETLGKNLGVKPGDEISFISQGLDGSIAAEKLIVIGLIRTGIPEYDKMLMLMPIERAKSAFAMGDNLHAIAVKLASPEKMKDIISLLHKVPSAVPLEIMGWDELMPVLVQFIIMDDVSAWIFDFILFMLVAFGILNTVKMSVFERTREFGIMLAIGTRPSQVVAMVLIESIIISAIGVGLGAFLGYCASYYFFINPIDYSAYAAELSVWNISTTIFPADVTWLNMSATAAFTFLFALLFSFFPARRAAKLKPVEAIRHL